MISKGGFAVTVCTIANVEYTRFKRRKIEAEFTGGDIHIGWWCHVVKRS
jgi:hypothetical protein